MKKFVLFLLLCILLCGCGSQEKIKQNEDLPLEDEPIVEQEEQEELEEAEEIVPEPKPLEIPDKTGLVKEAYAINPEVVGWLYIPGLYDVDAGVCHDPKSYSYHSRNVEGKKVADWAKGAYYTGLSNTFGETVDDLSTNTVIFGTSDLGMRIDFKDDDPTGPRFSQLFSFRDPDFAKKTPYIYFSTQTGNYLWEIFAVFYNDAQIDDGRMTWYIRTEPKKDYQKLLDTVRERSLYNYDVEVTTEDKILTLSTSTVGYGVENRNNYRYAIVAKLVRETEGLMEKEASFSINSNAPVPDSFSKKFQEYIANEGT